MSVGRLSSISATCVSHMSPSFSAALTLFQAEENPGFIDALVNILSAEQDNGVRQASV